MAASGEMRWTGYQTEASVPTPRNKRTASQIKRVLAARSLLMLRLPIVLDLGIVVGDAALVLRVVETIGQIDQHGGIGSNYLVTVRNSRRDQQLPSPQRSDVHSVADAKGIRVGTQVHQHHLQH